MDLAADPRGRWPALFAPTDGTGWRIAVGSLALGPVGGVSAMWRLRSRADAVRMANGHR